MAFILLPSSEPQDGSARGSRLPFTGRRPASHRIAVATPVAFRWGTLPKFLICGSFRVASCLGTELSGYRTVWLPNCLRVDLVQHPWIRNGLAQMRSARHPGDESFDAHAETTVLESAKPANVEVPLEGLARQAVLLDPRLE